MTCDEARAGVLAQLQAGPSGARAGVPDGVVEHVGGCLDCLLDLAVAGTAVSGKASRLLVDLFEGRACDLVERLMPELAQAELEGRPAAVEHPLAWRHLERCAGCRRAFAELCEVLRESEAGVYGTPPDRRT